MRSSSTFKRRVYDRHSFAVPSTCRRPSSCGRHRANRAQQRYVRLSEIRTHRLLVRSMSCLRLYATSPSPLHACTLCNNAGKARDPLISTIWSRLVARVKLREGISSPPCEYIYIYIYIHIHTPIHAPMAFTGLVYCELLLASTIFTVRLNELNQWSIELLMSSKRENKNVKCATIILAIH